MPRFIKFALSIILILALCVFIAKGDIGSLIDIVSISVIILFGVVYATTGAVGFKDRIIRFGDGAISGAWLGALLGLVQIFSLGEGFWNESVNSSLDIYKSLAIVAVCLFWGYLFKCLSFLVVENWPFDT